MFLLAAFLLVPWFFFLLARLFFVTRVLETIIYLPINLLNKVQTKLYRRRVLPNTKSIVKIFCIFLLISGSYASENIQQFTFSKGQVAEIKVGTISGFAVGNKSIISAKYDKAQGSLLVRSLMQGFSEIKLWSKKSKTLRIYVLSKNQQLKLLDLKNEFEALGLSARVQGQKVLIHGEIKDFTTYKLFFAAVEQRPKLAQPEVTIAHHLKKKIISKVYREFFTNFYDDIVCESSSYKIICKTTDAIIGKKKFIKDLESEYAIHFKSSNNFKLHENYQIELKIFQIEQLDGKEVQLGLDQIHLNLSQLLSSGLAKIKESTLLRLSQNNTEISTLASPKALIQLDSPLELKIGSEIPFQTSNNQGVGQTHWKFAGLKIDLNIKRKLNRFLIEYKTTLSRPTSGRSNHTYISGNMQSSSYLLELDRPLTAFEIDLKTSDNSENSIPLLGSIPILKNLFSSKSKTETYKRIIGIARLTRR